MQVDEKLFRQRIKWDKGKYWSPAPLVYGRVNRRSFKVSVRYQKAAVERATVGRAHMGQRGQAGRDRV